MRQQNWGIHHLHWHVVRIWNIIPEALRQRATGQEWSRHPVQEGEEGNGIEFLAMHRVMIRMLRSAFPQHIALFDGWEMPPTDPLPGNSSEPFSA